MKENQVRKAMRTVPSRLFEASMKAGSVIIDLAAPTGGNCVYTEANRAVLSPNGVTIVGVPWGPFIKGFQ